MEIEETRVQAASPTWFSQRARRETASNVCPIVNEKKSNNLKNKKKKHL